MNRSTQFPARRRIPPAYRRAFERLSQRLEEFTERERRANEARWTQMENQRITAARRALFGCAPE